MSDNAIAGPKVPFERLEDRKLLSANPFEGGRILAIPADPANAIDVDDSDGPARLGGSYNIEFNYTTSIPAGAQAAFDLAKAKWESVLLGDVPDVSNVPGAGYVDDLRINVSFPYIDGPNGTLGSAGPQYYRTGSNLPITGSMQFDSADVPGLISAGLFDEVIVHEMGHVIGIGTMWGIEGLRTGTGGTNPTFIGSNAVRAYNQFRDTGTVSSVPVENTGGQGTRDGHWRESVFSTELMTGYLNSVNQLSRLTVGSLMDQGYPDVNLDASDVFTLPTSNSLSNDVPFINTFVATPSTVTTEDVTLNLGTFNDNNGGAAEVSFFMETNGIPGLQSSTYNSGFSNPDLLIGSDTSAAGGWNFVVDNADVPAGETTFYARGTDTRGLASRILSATVDKSGDVVPPTVTNTVFVVDDSLPRVSFTFSEDVSASLSTDDLILFNSTKNQVVPAGNITLAYDAATNRADFFIEPASLQNGQYSATVLAAGVQDAAGNGLAANGSLDFSFLNGDANQDLVVDLSDFVILRNNFNSTSAVFTQGDFNWDGEVNLSDFVILRNNFNQSLPGPGGDDDESIF